MSCPMSSMPYISGVYPGSISDKTIVPPGGGGVLDIFLGGEVRPGLSYPDPV